MLWSAARESSLLLAHCEIVGIAAARGHDYDVNTFNQLSVAHVRRSIGAVERGSRGRVVHIGFHLLLKGVRGYMEGLSLVPSRIHIVHSGNIVMCVGCRCLGHISQVKIHREFDARGRIVVVNGVSFIAKRLLIHVFGKAGDLIAARHV